MITRKTCEPLEEDSFRPILHHYDGPKFRLELNVPEVFKFFTLLNVVLVFVSCELNCAFLFDLFVGVVSAGYF